MSFAWTGIWDTNKDGVMEGSQHNTMDINYEGPNPQMAAWYLGALKASVEMADYLNTQIGNQKTIVVVLGFLSAIIDNVPLVAATASGPQPSSVSSVKAGVIVVGSTQMA